MESITAVVDGARVQAFPTSVLLPPKAEFHEVGAHRKEGQKCRPDREEDVGYLENFGRGLAHDSLCIYT